MSTKSWKTTVAGAVAALGTYLMTQTDPAWLAIAGKVLATLGTLAIGVFARDNDKSSEDVGVK